ncbi:MAG: SGNH/GDSL hydrolase family protein [Bacilli bacterium]
MKYLLKHKTIITIILSLIIIFLIYSVNADKKIRYIALGDSLAAGQNPYGKIDYGYTDYVANYLNKNSLLKTYSKTFAKSGYRTIDLKNDINQNKTVKLKQEDLNIKKALREANLVTLSIGANDFLEKLNSSIYSVNLPPVENLTKIVDEVIDSVDKTIVLIKKYAKGHLIVIGYYNPLPKLLNSSTKQLDEVFAYTKEKYQNICNKNQATYIDIYELMKKHPEYLPNSFDIHPNIKGYEAISKEIINVLDKTVKN